MFAIAAFLLAATLAEPEARATLTPARLRETAAEEALYAQVWVNGIDTGLIVEFTLNGEELAASADDLRAIGLDVEPGSMSMPLTKVAGLTYQIDAPTQTVRILTPAAAMRSVDLSAPAIEEEDARPAWGGLVNYSFYVDDVDGRVSGGASAEMRLFGPAGTLSNTFLVRQGPDSRHFSVQRLESRYVLEDARSARRLTIGDFLSPDGSADGAIRAGGIQLATDFSLQPDLITAPIPHLSGGNGVPSTVDLYVDGVRRLSKDVDAGRFSIGGVPMVDGAGRVSLLVRDALGQESMQQVAFYSTRQLLRPGLTAGSVQMGFLRYNAFVRGDHYGTAFAAGTLRWGLTDWMTGEVRASAAGPVQVAGGSVTAKIEEFAVASVSGDLSSSDMGQGGQGSVSVRRDGGHFSIYAAAQKRFGSFRTLATQGTTLGGWQLQAGGSWQVPTLGSFSVSGTVLRTDDGRSRILAASWSRPIGPRFSAFANVVQSRIGGSHLLATAGLAIALSPCSAASIQTVHDRGGASATASWSRSAPMDGGLALRGGTAVGAGEQRLLGGATFRGQAGEIGMDAMLDRRGTSIRAFGSGAVVWLGHRPDLTARVGSSFAMVQTGQADVAVRIENRPAGRTRSDGSLLLPDLPANARARIAIDVDGIDMDHAADRTDLVIRTHSGGSVVRLPVHLVQAAAIKIVSVDGRPLPLGSIIRRKDGRTDVVGYDGAAYLVGVSGKMQADVVSSGILCHIEFVAANGTTATCQP